VTEAYDVMTIQFIQHRLFVCFVMATCLVMQARAQSLELEGSSSELQSTKAKIDTLGLADTASDGSFLLGSPSTSPSGLVSSRLSESDALSSGLNFNQFPSDFGNGLTLSQDREYQSFIIGQTWTTFTHRAALPNTLDVVGDVASVGRRQAQVRFTHHFLEDRLTFAAAIEDSNVRVEEDLLAIGTPRSPLADFICRLRYNGENGQIQLATIVRQLGFQPNQSNVRTGVGTGLNATGYVDLTSRSRTYGGILWGEGIGNYRDLPDIALTSATSAVALESLAWYAGVHHQWAKNWSSNLTYSQGNIDNTPNQAASSVRRLQYCAVNLIWQPTPYTFAGTEYLWGERMNLDSHSDDANRVMISFGFLLP